MRYFLYGYYGQGNFGDDLLLYALIQGIRQRDSAAEFTVRSRAFVPWLSGLENVSFTELDQLLESKGNRIAKGIRYLFGLLRQANDADVFVIGGGSLFIDKGRCNASLLYLWCVTQFMRLRGRQIVITGVGVDILTNPISLWLTRQILSAAHFVAVRDSFSLAYVAHLDHQKVRFAADLVLAGAFQFPVDHDRKPPGRNVIGVCFIDYFRTLEDSPPKHRMYVERIVECLRRYQDRYQFCCLAFQEGVGQRDDWMYRELQDEFPTLSYRRIASLADVDFLRGEIDFVITTRFHLGLLASILGKPVAVISHELKLAALGLQLSLPMISMEEFLQGENSDFVQALHRFDAHEVALRLDWQQKRAQANFDWLT